MKNFFRTILLIVLGLFVLVVFKLVQDFDPGAVTVEVNSFEECVLASGVVMESYPRQCRVGDGETFTENIGNELEKLDIIQIDFPRPGGEITSPVSIGGQARGFWFFEGDFPVLLTNWDGLMIAEGFVSADVPEGEDAMTEEFVQFSGELEFTKPDFDNRGTLILQRDNPSGLPENDDALEVPIKFK